MFPLFRSQRASCWSHVTTQTNQETKNSWPLALLTLCWFRTLHPNMDRQLLLWSEVMWTIFGCSVCNLCKRREKALVGKGVLSRFASAWVRPPGRDAVWPLCSHEPSAQLAAPLARISIFSWLSYINFISIPTVLLSHSASVGSCPEGTAL